MEFGIHLRLLREERGLTQAKVAERMGIAPNRISALEARRTPPVTRVLDKIADALDCDVVFELRPRARRRKAA